MQPAPGGSHHPRVLGLLGFKLKDKTLEPCIHPLSIPQIESVQPAPGGGDTAAVVTARVRESADLWGENGRQADSYSSTYRVEYTLTRQPQGGWRISEAVVLGS